MLPDHALLDAGHHVGHAALQDALLGAHIPEVFPIESGHVQALAGGGRDGLRVARPAQALVPLGAVAGHVQKIVLHAPEGVLEEPVHRGAAGVQRYDLGHGTAQMHGGEVLRPDGMIAVHFHIAKAKEREVGPHLARCPVGDIGKAGDGRAVVFMVEFAVLQDLPRRERDAGALLQSAGEAHPAGQILTEVQDRVALWRADQFLHREAVTFHHRQTHPVLQWPAALRGYQLRRADNFRLDARVPGLPVIDIGETDGRAQFLPALVRGCEQGIALPQLRDGVEPVAVEIRIAALKAQTALKPALAQGDDQAVLPFPQQRRHVIGLDSQMEVIGVIAGGQVLFADLLAVQIDLVDAQTAEIEPRRAFPLFTGKTPAQQGGIPILRGADPAGRPGLVPLAGLEKGGGLGVLSVRGPDAKRIVVARPGKQSQRHGPAEAVGRGRPAAVEDGLSRRADAQGNRAYFAPLPLRGPGKNRLLHGEAQGLGQIADAQIVQLHSSLLNFRCIAPSPSTL